MSNYMSGVANLLGVELEEVFRIDGTGHYFRFTDTGLEVSVCTSLAELKHTAWFSEESCEESCMLSGLLTGELKIKKRPWKPARHDLYYIPFPTDKMLWEYATWTDSDNDYSRLNRGLVFKTKEEAIEAAKKMLAAVQEQAVE